MQPYQALILFSYVFMEFTAIWGKGGGIFWGDLIDVQVISEVRKGMQDNRHYDTSLRPRKNDYCFASPAHILKMSPSSTHFICKIPASKHFIIP